MLSKNDILIFINKARSQFSWPLAELTFGFKTFKSLFNLKLLADAYIVFCGLLDSILESAIYITEGTQPELNEANSGR